ncbi:hypothetical protein ACIQWA_16945 [Kitasatospora sp. NPDC098652]|uniref:hypothetical protein n=1 Tax=Kitasatospora sp. NPDC098652 TaxID=3364095 RepID=UPI0037F97A1E
MDQVNAFSRQVDFHGPPREDAVIPADVLKHCAQLHGVPRHLGIHSGGMVLAGELIGRRRSGCCVRALNHRVFAHGWGTSPLLLTHGEGSQRRCWP